MGHRCECQPCTLPRAHGGRCPSTDTDIDGARSSHCIPCAFCCCDDEEGE